MLDLFPFFFIIFVLYFFLTTEATLVHQGGQSYNLTYAENDYLSLWCGTLQISLCTHTDISCQLHL